MTDEIDKDWVEGEFGSIWWRTGKLEDGSIGSLDPFSKMLRILKESRVEENTRTAAINVHDDLDVCRSIAISLFGRDWQEHILPIYDRFKEEIRELREQEKEEE